MGKFKFVKNVELLENPKMEKMLLRDAMRPLLPDFIANRRKEAFSDGVSSRARSWYEILRDSI